jgi:hypothetical protein
MSIIGSNILAGSSGQAGGGYAIERSLRFNSADSAYLSRTFSSPTDQDVFTLSLWVKRSALGSTQQLFGVSTNHSFGFTSGDALNLTFGGSSALTTTALFRDPSAWYHIVWEQNANAHELYVNGVSVGTATATSNTFNTAAAHQIGAANTTNYFNGYLDDIYFIDGQALDPTSFGEFDATTGVWVPIEYTGTYGTNGFHLDFADNASTTTIGYDAAGSNDWTANNLSVTAGAGNDSLVHVPTNGTASSGGDAGGAVRGNYCTWNPLINGDTAANGNLDVTNDTARGTHKLLDYDAYWEITSTGGTTTAGVVSDGGTTNTTTIADTKTYGFKLSTTGSLDYINITDGGSFTNITTGLTGVQFPYASAASATTGSLNTGQRPFAAAAPAGFKGICTANLPAPLVTKPNTVMDVALYTGNGSTQSISSLNFSPDFLWFKSRSSTNDHVLFDAVRGRAAGMRSNGTDAEYTSSAGNDLASFDSAGFTVGAPQNWSSPNGNGLSVVAWCWDAGTTTTTNTQGSISSQVRANASAGFSVVTYTGNGSAGATIGHGLGVAPQMIIVKNRDAADAWQVYHSANTANPETDYLVLNDTAATADALDRWNDTAPTSTVFSLGDGVEVNTNTEDYVAYCWTGLAGYSSFGSYTGSGSNDGSFIFTGFAVKYLLVKCTSAAGQEWVILDNSRSPYNVTDDALYANASDAEASNSTRAVDLLSNGFKFRNGSSGATDFSGRTYIYAAFAEHPFQYARAR